MKISTRLFAAAMIATTLVAAPAFADSQKEKIRQDSAQLSPEKAKMYNDAMQSAAESNKELREQIRKAHEEADAILTAPKFDKAAFLAKAAEIDGLYAKTRAKMNETFVSVVEKLSQDDRKALVKARNENRRRRS